MSSAAPARWPDGSLKHRWIASTVRGTLICRWCGHTKGPRTQGNPCSGIDVAPAPVSTGDLIKGGETGREG